MIQLPHEIVINIIQSLVPDPCPLALHPQDPVTQTLLSFTVVSRGTYEIATRLLYTHCLYIDTPWRMHKLCFSFLSQADQHPTHLTGQSLANVHFKSLAPVEGYKILPIISAHENLELGLIIYQVGHRLFQL